MKKIALVLSTTPKDGGKHQYAVLVVECLVEGMRTDYELVAICLNPFWKRWCREHGIEQCDCTLPGLSTEEQKFNLAHPHLARLYNTYLTPFGDMIRKQKINVLFYLQQGYLPNYNVKLIAPIHDLMHRYEPDFPEVIMEYEERELSMKCLAKYAACLLVDSSLGKQQFRESYMRQNAKTPFIVKMPFIVPEHIWNIKEEYISVPDKYVFYPAQFWKHKNHINLIRAIKLLQDEISDIHLVLVGSEKNNCKEIKQVIAENGLESNVTILGFVNDENMTYLYRHAVAMIMPSYFGPTNIPPLEAMALKCPVAVSNKYAMPQQVGEAGLLFDPDSPEQIADCIRKLWTDENLRERMKRLGYMRVQKWTRREFGEKLRKLMRVI